MRRHVKLDPNENVKNAKERFAVVLDGYKDEIADDASSFAWNCDSPIEALLLCAFEFRRKFWHGDTMRLPVHVTHCFYGPPYFEQFASELMAGLPDSLPRSIFVQPQVLVKSKWVDFICGFVDLNGKPRFLIIECDGHEFHIMNKEQAAKDRQKDRTFLRENMPTMRFTGSEIYRDPIACVDEIRDYFTNYFRADIEAQSEQREEISC